MKITNLTPRPVRVVIIGRGEITFEPSGTVAHLPVNKRQIEVMHIEGREIPSYWYEMDSTIYGLPPRQHWVRYIVSPDVARIACRFGRHDTIVPDDLVPDKHGRIVAALSFRLCCKRALD